MIKQSHETSVDIARTTSITFIGLVIVSTPMLILRSASVAITGAEISLAYVAGVVSWLVTLVVLRFLAQVVPRRYMHQIAHRYIGGWAGVVLAAAKILAYAVVIMMGVDLITIAVASVAGPEIWTLWLPPIVICLLAIPSFYAPLQSSFLWTRWLTIIALVGLVGMLLTGLIREAFGDIDFAAINEARKAAFEAEPLVTRYFPRLDSALGALYPAGLLVLMSERVMVSPEKRRVKTRPHLRLYIPAFFLIALTLYFAVVLYLPGRRLSVPAIPIARALFGVAGVVFMAVLVALAGLAAAYAAYQQLPRIIRDLATDTLLPRHLAARDSVRSRNAIVLIIALLAAFATSFLDTARALAMVYIFLISAIMLVTSVAMVYRSRSILHDSTHAEKRSQAVLLQWVFLVYSLAVLAVLGIVSWIHPEWSLSAVALLFVPGVFLWSHRRGQTRVSNALAVDDGVAVRRLPTRVHGLVLIERGDQPALKAVTWARSLRLSSLSAVVLDVDPVLTSQIQEQWSASLIPVSLTVLGRPQGAVRGPVIEYVRALRKIHPDDVIMVFIPRVIATGWWERFYVQHSTPKIVTELRLEPGVMVTEVPYRIDVSGGTVNDDFEENYGHGDVDV